MYIRILAQLANSFVLSTVRVATGGRLRIALSRGVAFTRDIQDILTAALVTVIQGSVTFSTCAPDMKVKICQIVIFIGYGMTVVRDGVIRPPELVRYEYVGLLVPSTEIKYSTLGCSVPSEQYTAPRRSLHSWTFSSQRLL